VRVRQTRRRCAPTVRRCRRLSTVPIVPPGHGRVLLGVVRAAGRRPFIGRVPLCGPGGAMDAFSRVRVGPLRAAHRQRSVRRHRIRVAAVLPRAQRTDTGRPARTPLPGQPFRLGR